MSSLLAEVDIINGKDALITENPWQVAIGKKGSCGGSIISKNLVITALHCPCKRGLRILGGDSFKPKKIATVKKCIPYPEDERPDNHDDIKIILLDRNLKFSKKINKVKIFSHKEEYYELLFKREAKYYASGWGRVSRHKKTKSNSLKRTGFLKPDSHFYHPKWDRCYSQSSDIQNSFNISFDYFYHDKKRAFVDTKKDMSQVYHGDSGGPLIVSYKGQKILYGVTSAGICNSTIGVFSLIESYFGWIQKQLNLYK